jgi:hypothetical protein
MTSTRRIRLPKAIALIIAFGALLDGLFGGIYLRETWGKSTQNPRFGWAVLGLLATSAFFLTAKKLEPRTAKNIAYSVALLTLIQTASYAAQCVSHFSQIRLLFHMLEFGGDLLIIYTCLVHFRKA